MHFIYMGEAPLILIVDDNSDDVMLLKRGFARNGVINPIFSVNSGRQAISYLKGEPPYTDRDQNPIPSVILLDLQMPDGDGFEVLQWIRNKFPQGGLLVVVLTRVEEIRKINRAYSLGANSFLTKPGNDQARANSNLHRVLAAPKCISHSEQTRNLFQIKWMRTISF